MLCTAKYTNLSYLISENTFPQNVLKTDPGKLKATLNVTSSIKSYNFDRWSSLIKKELFFQRNINAVVINCCFTSAQQSAQYVEK